MGASHNQRVDVFIQNLCQIAARHFLGDRIFCPALFHERHEQRTRFSVNGDRRICLGNELLVEAALNSALGCDDADALVLRRLDGHLCARFYHADDREIDLFFDRIECQRTCGVAGDDDCLDLLGFQKVYDLAGITDDGIFRFGTVRHTRGISKIYDSFVGQVSHNLTHYGQSADTGIKDADRRLSVCFHTFLHFSSGITFLSCRMGFISIFNISEFLHFFFHFTTLVKIGR